MMSLQMREVELMARSESPTKIDTRVATATVDGVIVPVGVRPVSAQEVSDMIRGVAGRMYVGTDPAKQGMTLIEAALYETAVQAAEHGGEDLDRLLNRLLGKPIQQVASISTTATLKEFLDHIIREESPAPIDVGVVAKEDDPFAD